MIRLALDQVDAEVTRLKTEHAGTVRIEEDIPETPPEQEVSTLGDEILDFYQPDEDLKIEDVLPDLDALTPEDETEAKELRSLVRRALAEMPREWRRALLLRDLKGRSRAEITRAMGKSELEIDRMVQFASGYLRGKIAEAGFHFRESPKPAA